MGLLVADVANFDGIANRGLRDGIDQVGAGMDGLAIHFSDDVAGLQAGFFRRAAGLNGFDHDAVGRAEFFQENGIIAAILLESDADGSAGNFAIGDELVVNADDSGGW